MIRYRRANERGKAEHGWLQSRHTFSFANYYDPEHMGFSDLRVINDDRVRGGAGFGTHPHRDMEIISYVLDGALEHKDSMGTGSVIRPGDVQLMSAGTGVLHSEYNASPDEPVHFLQIWIVPAERGGRPNYQQQHFSTDERQGALKLVVSPDGAGDSLQIRQDMRLFAGLLSEGERARYEIPRGRRAWLHVARGEITADGRALSAGDAASYENEPSIDLSGVSDDAELLLFDLR